MSKIKYKDSYNEIYTSKQSAAKQEDRKYTAEQLRAIAEKESIEENLINFIYTRAASVLKGKIDAAYQCQLIWFQINIIVSLHPPTLVL